MKRAILEKMEAWKEKIPRKPLLLRGARQTGKTYLLKAFGASFPKAHYVNFEEDPLVEKVFEQDLKPGRIVKELSFHLNTPIDIQRDLLIFDEIQSAPRALTSLKYFAEEMPGFALCAAGSLLGVHLSPASFPVGKVEEFSMRPMSFQEFLLGIGDQRSFDFIQQLKAGDSIPEVIHAQLWDQLKVYFVVGGLPEVVATYAQNQDNPFVALERVRQRQEGLVIGYLADMAKHSGKENSMHLERLWRQIPSQLAREQGGSAPKFKFKGVVPGMKGFSQMAGAIDWLKKAELILPVNMVTRGQLPFSAYAKENFFKLYLFDVGLLGALSRLPPKTLLDYGYGSYQGYFAENFVAQEFVTAGERELFYWREGTAEVEFLRESNGRVLPIEVKSGWVTKAKSLSVFAAKYRPDYRTIMSAWPPQWDEQNKVHHYPLYLAGRFPLSSPVLATS